MLYYAIAFNARGEFVSIVEMPGRRRLRRFLWQMGIPERHRIYTVKRARELWPGLGVTS